MNKMEFKKGDIVTYDGCPTTIAVFDYKYPELNDSGDPYYKCFIAVNKEHGIYLGNLVISDDIRLATQEEINNFYSILNDKIWELKQEIFTLKYGPNSLMNGGKIENE